MLELFQFPYRFTLFSMHLSCFSVQKITTQIGQPKTGKRDFEFVAFDLDNDSRLNTKEGKQRLVEAGLHDEIKVGRWIAEKLRDKDDILADNVCNFILKKKWSTLRYDEVR